MKFFTYRARLVAGLIAIAGAAGAPAAIITVPAGQPTIEAAITASSSGDEIRVQNTHTETSTGNAITGKTLIIRSYDSAYSSPSPGAKWVLSAGGSGTTGGLLTLSGGASVTLDGFSQVTAPGGCGVFVNSGCSATVTGCTFSGFALANTAAILAPSGASGVSVTADHCAFTSNGRSIYYSTVTGTNTLTVSHCAISASTSNYIEFRCAAGAHTFNMSDSTVSQTANSPMRLYFFNTPAGAVVNSAINIDRCVFTAAAAAVSSPVAISGFMTDATTGANASSAVNVTATNCLFDMRLSTAANGFGIGTISAGSTLAAERKANLTVRHCTILTNNAATSGVFLQAFNTGTIAVQNTIMEGTANAALRNDGSAGTGMITSAKNLFNTTAVSAGTNSAATTLSGMELTGVPAQFVSSSDFYLQPASPARDAGADLGVTTDLDNNARPQGAAPDLGAYEASNALGASSWSLYTR